ncbi:MAG: flagellar hook-length control protein FliK, partial [Spirochaetota bacterium]
AAVGKRSLQESGEGRRADRADAEDLDSKNMKKGGRTEQNEQSTVKQNQKSDEAQKPTSEEEPELQAQQAAQELAAQQKVVQEQTSQEKAAAPKTSRDDVEGSKQLSLQKGGDENREVLSGRELRSRRSEGRQAGEGEDRPRLTVIDRRSASARSGNNNRNNSGSHNGSNNGSNSGAGFQNQSGTTDLSNGLSGRNVSGGGSKSEGDGLQVMQVNLRADGTSTVSSAQTAGSSGETGIRGQLLQQLQEHLNKDIVKRSSILIRENGSGEIKLDLKPDDLGQVRIRITMENNHIAGKIFVENSSVKEAFDQNMQQLYRAFKEHGFEDAALNVSVGDQGREQQERGRSYGPQPRVGSQQIHSLNEQSASVSDESSGERRLVDVMA